MVLHQRRASRVPLVSGGLPSLTARAWPHQDTEVTHPTKLNLSAILWSEVIVEPC